MMAACINLMTLQKPLQTELGLLTLKMTVSSIGGSSVLERRKRVSRRERVAGFSWVLISTSICFGNSASTFKYQGGHDFQDLPPYLQFPRKKKRQTAILHWREDAWGPRTFEASNLSARSTNRNLSSRL